MKFNKQFQKINNKLFGQAKLKIKKKKMYKLTKVLSTKKHLIQQKTKQLMSMNNLKYICF